MGKQNELKAVAVESQVQLDAKDGVAFIEQASPLTRLHYFDGKFLRADAFALEQDYHRTRTRLANLAGGWGVVNGLGIALAGNQLTVGAGLAITATGNFVLATGDFTADLADLIEVAAPAPLTGNDEFGNCPEPGKDGTKESTGLNIYEITVGPVEGLCGNEAVYGKLCESACVSSSQHPYWREGVVLRLRPIGLKLPTSTAVVLAAAHLRNRVASAYFAAEPWLTPSALSAAGLASEVWCQPASLYGRNEVVIGLLVRDAGVNRVIDAWSGRRERMDTQARGYWQGRMAMRPWNVFVAQILQFQCQLAALFDGTGISPVDDCDALRGVLDQTRKDLAALHKKYSESTENILRQLGERATERDAQTLSDQVKLSYAEIYDISNKLASLELGKGALPKQRLLLSVGFVELPPAGYLPVVPGKQDLGEQTARMFGEGVRLHYYAVRRDEIAHLVEQAQHLERISLTRGLDDASRIEDVEIFVPDGEVYGAQAATPGTWWQVDMAPAAMGAFDLGLSTTESTVAGLMSTQPTAAVKRSARSTAKAAAAVGGLPADDATIKEVQAKLAQLMRAALTRNVRGLARTEGSRDDGSYGFTLVGKLDIDDLVDEMRNLLDSTPQADPNGTVNKQINALAAAAIYLAGDVAADPLSLALNSSTSLKGEMRFGKQAVEVTGTLTTLFDRPAAAGGSERVVQLSLIAVDADGKPNVSRGRISLWRKGDRRDGQFVMDDASHDPSTSPNIFEWKDAPRTAAMYVVAEPAREAVALKLMRGVTDTAAGMAATPGAAAAAGAEPTGTRKELLRMNGLDGMPTLDSAIGAAAMNALIYLAEVGDDAAFLARARHRLFPTLDTPAAERVRALLDWVMFRRARTNLCCPVLPQTPVRPAVEAFQVWHLAVADAAALKTLQAALDGNDAEQLASFKFQRVGVLRYRDDNTAAEESQAQVEAMWRQASPAPQVVLGRHWEQAPSSGQGWQNRFRLLGMLDQIKEITAPPTPGEGAIAHLDAVSPPLSDSAMDGGFLVVTQAVATVTRKALLIYGSWERPNHFVNREAPRADQRFVNDQPQDTTLAQFIGKLSADQPVRGITLATTKAAPDAGAPARMQAALAALKDAGKPVPSATRQTVEAINDHDRKQLVEIGIKAEDYDEVIFFELNEGA